MEKVKVTQKQADWLERYELTQEQIDHYIDIQPYKKRPDSPIVDWSSSKVARVLYSGYEVEPEFKVGEYIAHKRTGVIKEIETSNVDFINKHYLDKENIRHANPSEIAEEKERRFWKKHDRELWELVRGDVLGKKNAVYTVWDVEENRVTFNEFAIKKSFDELRESFKVVCFIENRLDGDSDE